MWSCGYCNLCGIHIVDNGGWNFVKESHNLKQTGFQKDLFLFSSTKYIPLQYWGFWGKQKGWSLAVIQLQKWGMGLPQISFLASWPFLEIATMASIAGGCHIGIWGKMWEKLEIFTMDASFFVNFADHKMSIHPSIHPFTRWVAVSGTWCSASPQLSPSPCRPSPPEGKIVFFFRKVCFASC